MAEMSDKKVYFSNVKDPAVGWEDSSDYMTVWLMPRKWWSIMAWKLAFGLRPYVRFRFVTPLPKFVATYNGRVNG
jgi:hypothetical protein